MTPTQLRNSILQTAITGALVPQNPDEGSAEQLLQQIEDEKRRLIAERNAAKIAAARAAGKSDAEIKKLKLEKYTAPKPVNPEDAPFEIPKSWRWVRLGDMCEFLSRGKSPKYSDIKQYPVFAQKCNLKEGGISLEKALFLDPETLPKWSDDYKLRNGDVLINSTGTGTVCRTRLFDESCLGNYPFVVPDSHVSVVRTFQCIDSSFVCYYIMSFSTQKFLEDNLSGSTNQKELSIGVLQNLRLPLPPLPEQRRIVSKLEELLPLVDEYGEAQTELEVLNAALPDKLKKSLLQQAITGRLVPQAESDGSAEQLLLQIEDEKRRLIAERNAAKIAAARAAGKSDAEIKKLKLEKYTAPTTVNPEDAPFEIPASWRWVRLGDYVQMKMGKTPPRNISEYWINGIYNWVSISDMSDYGIVKQTKDKVSEKSLSVFGNISKAGTLLMSFKLTVGRTSILNIDAFHNEAIVSIYPYCDDTNSARNYMFYVLPSIANMGKSKDAIKGKTLNSDSLYNLLLPLPPLPEQRRIVAKLEEMFLEIEKLGNQE